MVASDLLLLRKILLGKDVDELASKSSSMIVDADLSQHSSNDTDDFGDIEDNVSKEDIKYDKNAKESCQGILNLPDEELNACSSKKSTELRLSNSAMSNYDKRIAIPSNRQRLLQNVSRLANHRRSKSASEAPTSRMAKCQCNHDHKFKSKVKGTGDGTCNFNDESNIKEKDNDILGTGFVKGRISNKDSEEMKSFVNLKAKEDFAYAKKNESNTECQEVKEILDNKDGVILRRKSRRSVKRKTSRTDKPLVGQGPLSEEEQKKLRALNTGLLQLESDFRRSMEINEEDLIMIDNICCGTLPRNRSLPTTEL